MPSWVCSTGDITTDTTCSDRGGLLTVFWIDQSEVDWDAMALVANYDDATHTILDWVLEVGGAFGELTFTRRNGRLDSLYTRDNGFYEVNLTNLIFQGHSASKTISLGQAIACCGIVAQIFDNNGLARVIGKEFVNGAWIDPVDNVALSRHLDTTGAFGAADDKARDEIDISGSHSYPPAYSSVDLATMRTL